MKPVTLVLFLAALCLYAQEPGGECGRRAHQCHCPRMVNHAREHAIEECNRMANSQRELDACLEQVPMACDIIEHPNEHGEADSPDKCQQWCHPERCFCADGRCGPEMHQPHQETPKKGKRR